MLSGNAETMFFRTEAQPERNTGTPSAAGPASPVRRSVPPPGVRAVPRDAKLEYTLRMKKHLPVALNALITGIVTVTVLRMTLLPSGPLMTAAGWGVFRYYTVLSNVFCALTCLAALLRPDGRDGGRCPLPLYGLQLSGTGVVLVTFLVVVAFLGPLYGYRAMFTGASFWLHLVVPMLALLRMLLLRPDRPLPFPATLPAVAPTLLYGAVYALVNALTWTGRSDPATDVYGFLKWGWWIGAGFLFSILVVNWLCCVFLRAFGGRAAKRAAS